MVSVNTISGILGMIIGFSLLYYSSIMSPSGDGGLNAFSDFSIIILTLYASVTISEKIISFLYSKN